MVVIHTVFVSLRALDLVFLCGLAVLEDSGSDSCHLRNRCTLQPAQTPSQQRDELVRTSRAATKQREARQNRKARGKEIERMMAGKQAKRTFDNPL